MRLAIGDRVRARESTMPGMPPDTAPVPTVYYSQQRPASGSSGDLWIHHQRVPTPGKPYAVSLIIEIWNDGMWEPRPDDLRGNRD